MKKIIIGVLALVGLLIVGILVAASLQPPDYHVERSIVIAAPPAEVYALISDLNRYREWSPWESLDPDMKRVIEGQPGQVGMSYAWAGDNKVGEGKMTISQAVEGERVGLELEFLKPFASTCQVSWVLTPEGDGTRMTWSMDGRNEGLIPRVFCLFMDMDQMIGKDFDKGLQMLKTVCES
ncbi:MAG: SRPBCC family protein [Candidatus Eremiobacteraeota bacterium]|nr:SRPBCC family protein [Candidatus Eremiobacteraeota bacterium]